MLRIEFSNNHTGFKVIRGRCHFVACFSIPHVISGTKWAFHHSPFHPELIRRYYACQDSLLPRKGYGPLTHCVAGRRSAYRRQSGENELRKAQDHLDTVPRPWQATNGRMTGMTERTFVEGIRIQGPILPGRKYQCVVRDEKGSELRSIEAPFNVCFAKAKQFNKQTKTNMAYVAIVEKETKP